MIRNWKTTLFGAMLAVGQALVQSPKPVLALIGQALSVIGAAGVGAAATDKGTVK